MAESKNTLSHNSLLFQAVKITYHLLSTKYTHFGTFEFVILRLFRISCFGFSGFYWTKTSKKRCFYKV